MFFSQVGWSIMNMPRVEVHSQWVNSKVLGDVDENYGC
jgi:hypothetical protein